MKKAFVRAVMKPDQLETVRKQIIKDTGFQAYQGVALLLADIVDTAVKGTECYATFGISKDRSAILLTIHLGDQKLYAQGATLAEVSSACEELL